MEVVPPVGWKRQRKLTKYVFVIEAFLLGLLNIVLNIVGLPGANYRYFESTKKIL